MSRIASAFHLHNGLVAVFDDNGEQVSELQGWFHYQKRGILAAADEETKFYGAGWGASRWVGLNYQTGKDLGLPARTPDSEPAAEDSLGGEGPGP